jgi:nucleoside-diphosphate-sugar epimerase
MIKEKKILVTGGAGFIGSNLVEALANKNKVVVLDNFITGRKENLNGIDNIEVVRGSITNLSLLQRLFTHIDCVFHQAALPSVPRSVKKPLKTHQMNANGTLNVLIAAKKCGVKKVIYASSSSVYGDTPTLPKSENMIPNPQSPYAVSKLVGEYYCKVFYEVYGLPTASLRYFNVYGPKQNPKSRYAAAIPKFIERVKNNQPPIVYGDGEQTRDFTYVRDVVNANILAMESEEANGQVINIARGERITINKLSKLIIKLFGKNLKPIYRKSREGDIQHSLADVSKAKHLIGWKTKYSLKEGLKEMTNL